MYLILDFWPLFRVAEAVSKQQPPRGKKLSAKRATATKTKAAAETTDDHSYVPAPSTSTSSSSGGDRGGVVKYRRMRDLNNEASKRCRQNRKRKQVHSLGIQNG